MQLKALEKSLGLIGLFIESCMLMR